MNINDLVAGRLYKIKNELMSSDYERSEDLAMFLRAESNKAYVLTITGIYKKIELSRLEIPEKNYMEVFDETTIENFSTVMRRFFSEYQKYNKIKYSKKSGFKSGSTKLNNLNTLQTELKNLEILPRLTLAIENYFNVYKEMGINFESLEDLIVDFAYIPEWEESFNKLRGFDFSSKKLTPKQMKKYTNEALMMHHLYTNLFLRPNFKNIKAEWVDLLLEKFKIHSSSINTNDSIISTIESIKWKCMVENTPKEPVNNNVVGNNNVVNNITNSTYINAQNTISNTNTPNTTSNTNSFSNSMIDSILNQIASNNANNNVHTTNMNSSTNINEQKQLDKPVNRINVSL